MTIDHHPFTIRVYLKESTFEGCPELREALGPHQPPVATGSGFYSERLASFGATRPPRSAVFLK